MTEERRQILEMLAAGKINADEADRLLGALQGESAAAAPAATQTKPAPKFLRVIIDSTNDWKKSPVHINVRVPIALLRAGVRLASLIPTNAQERVNEELHKNGVDQAREPQRAHRPVEGRVRGHRLEARRREDQDLRRVGASMEQLQPVAIPTVVVARPKPWTVFASGNFRKLWVGTTLSLFGDFFSYIAIAWLVLQLTGSSLALGSVLVAQALPRGVLMLVGGALADRLSPRLTMLGSMGLRAVFVAPLAVLVLTGPCRSCRRSSPTASSSLGTRSST